LATPIEPLQQNPYGFVEELFQAGDVPVDSVVVVISTEFGVQPLEEHWQPEVAILLAPRGEALESSAEFLAGRAALEVLCPLAILAPSKLKPQKLEAGFPARRCRLNGMIRVLAADSSSPNFSSRCPSTW
jgi:hypothetical protein